MKPSNPTERVRKSGRQRGFTLLEVLVAFALLGLTLGVILQVFSGGLRNAAEAGNYIQAAIIADSKLALLGNEFPITAGERNGEEGIYSWRMRIEPNRDTDELSNPTTGRYQLYAITLRVQWHYGKQRPELQFMTYRLEAVDGS